MTLFKDRNRYPGPPRKSCRHAAVAIAATTTKTRAWPANHLRGLACRLAGGAEGVCNGIDLSQWSPYKDRYLHVKYDSSTIDQGKAIAKETLQAELGLKVPSPPSPALEKESPCILRSFLHFTLLAFLPTCVSSTVRDALGFRAYPTPSACSVYHGVPLILVQIDPFKQEYSQLR